MAHVIAAPEMVEAASTDLATISSTLNAAHMAAAAPTVAVMPAAADEVSASMAQLFSQHAQDYQASARQAAAFQEQFAQNLKTSAASYTSIEDAIASLLRSFETSLSSFYGALVGQIVRFIIGSESWINLVPPPLRTFVVGVPFLSIFVIAIPVAILLTLTEAVIEAITGLPGVI
jgi:hypothetical protein